MATRSSMLDIAVRRQVYLERLKASITAEFAQLISVVGPDSVKAVYATDVERLNELSKAELEELLGKISQANLRTLTVATDELKKKLATIAEDAATFEQKTLDAAAKEGTRIKSAASDAYDYARNNPISATGEKLDSFLKGYAEKQTAQISNAIASGYANGLTNSDIVRMIRGTRVLNYTDGIVATSRRNAEMMVRTAVQHVASAARFAAWEANADILDGYTFVATLDGRTTLKCRSLDGQTFRLGQGPVPPVHIGCRSTTVASIAKFAFLDEGATRSAEDGPVDAKETYYEWLKRQTVEFQESAIGKTRAQLLRKGGLSSEEFARLNIGTNFEPLTLVEMRKLEPVAFDKAGL